MHGICCGVLDILLWHTPVIERASPSRSIQALLMPALLPAAVDLPGILLTDSMCVGDAGWPDLRRMLLLKLVAVLFPTTDRKHPVTEPAALLLGSYLSNCGLSRAQHVATGGLHFTRCCFGCCFISGAAALLMAHACVEMHSLPHSQYTACCLAVEGCHCVLFSHRPLRAVIDYSTHAQTCNI